MELLELSELVKDSIFNSTSFFNNFEIQNYYQNEPRFIDIYSRNNLPKTKDRAYVINLDGYKSIGTHWIALELNIFQKKFKSL